MPEAIAAAVVEELALTGTEALVATVAVEIAVSVVISVGIGLLEQAIQGSPQQPPPPHARRQNFRQAIAARTRYYGRCRVGGPYAFLGQRIPPGGTTGVLYQVILLGQGEFDEFEDWYHNDELIEFESGDHGNVQVPKHYLADPGHYVELTWKVGTVAQVASTAMTDDWPGQWTDDFTLTEIGYCVVYLVSPSTEHFNTVYPSGLPITTTVARCNKVWDPRDEAQDYNAHSTWKWSPNWALCALDGLRHPDGLRLPDDMFLAAIDVWKAEADYCDIWRSLKNGGSERHLNVAGGYDLTDQPKNWLKKICDVADARIVLRGDGAIVPDVGRWKEPELTITDAEVYTYVNFGKGLPKADVRNVINGTFIAREYDFVEQQADPFINEDSIDVDGEHQITMDLSFAPSHAQARWRMHVESYRQNPDGWCGRIITNAYGLRFLTPNSDGSPKRNIRLILDEFGIDIPVEATSFGFDPKTARCTFDVRQSYPNAYDWDADTDEGDAPSLAKDTASNGVENPFNLTLVSVSAGVITVTVDTPIDTGLNLYLVSRPTDDAIGDRDASKTNLTLSGWGGHTGALSSGSRYDILARYYNGASPADYSDWRWIRGILIP